MPLFASMPELCRAMFPGVGNEIVIPVELRPKSFDPPMPEAHVFVENDRNSIDGFEAIGGTERIFGNRRTIPGRNKLQGIGLVV